MADVDIPALIDLDVSDRSCLMILNISNHLTYRIGILYDLLEIVDRYWVLIICNQHQPYVRLHVYVSTLYTTHHLGKVSSTAHTLISSLSMPSPGAVLESVDSNTLRQIEKKVSQCVPCQCIKNTSSLVLCYARSGTCST